MCVCGADGRISLLLCIGKGGTTWSCMHPPTNVQVCREEGRGVWHLVDKSV